MQDVSVSLLMQRDCFCLIGMHVCVCMFVMCVDVGWYCLGVHMCGGMELGCGNVYVTV